MGKNSFINDLKLDRITAFYTNYGMGLKISVLFRGFPHPRLHGGLIRIESCALILYGLFFYRLQCALLRGNFQKQEQIN